MGKQNEKLLKNIELYEKKKAKQQESKISGSDSRSRKNNKKTNINVYSSK
tara:strand:+ start:851 stop:1000 length:150 start_codon:yes stop_codon:yes gene_type:complete